jgi:hypothetical protein
MLPAITQINSGMGDCWRLNDLPGRNGSGPSQLARLLSSLDVAAISLGTPKGHYVLNPVVYG